MCLHAVFHASAAVLLQMERRGEQTRRLLQDMSGPDMGTTDRRDKDITDAVGVMYVAGCWCFAGVLYVNGWVYAESRLGLATNWQWFLLHNSPGAVLTGLCGVLLGKY